MRQQSLLSLAGAAGLLAILWMLLLGPQRSPQLWFTPDQQGDHLMRLGKYAEAAKVYVDPVRQGTAFYRAGDFKSAATAFSHGATPEAVFNRANALVMLGKYDDAVKGYDRALKLRTNWKEAQDNRAVAVVRRERMKTTGGDVTGGEIKPDEVIFQKGPKQAGQPVQVDAGGPMKDQDLQALWLRRVQTKPADFLRAKFVYQSNQPPAKEEP